MPGNSPISSSRTSSTPELAGKPRRLLSGIALLSLLFLLLAFAPSASASFHFVTKWGTAGSGDGQFNVPLSVATDPSGNVYVADSSNHRIQKFDSSGNFLTKWGSSGSGDGQLSFPRGVATDSAGNVYVSDFGNDRIQKFDSSGNFLTKWGSSGSGDGQFDGPAGVATDSSGNVYVVDYDNERVQKFDSSGTFLTKWGSYGSGNGQFDNHFGIATDPSGNVYVTDYFNGRIQKFDSSGTYLAQLGGLFVFGVDTDSAGSVYVPDYGNGRLRKYDSSGTFLTQVGSTGSGDGQFNAPYDVATDSAGNVYVADYGNNRIQKFRQETQTVINSGPSGLTGNTSPSFTFSSTEPGASFECRLDSSQEADFQPCSSPMSYSSLADGPHTFEVRARSPLGYTGPPASRTFTVDTVPPDTMIDSGPSGLTNDLTPTFSFSASQVGSSFECKVDDSGSYAPCFSPRTTSQLTDGPHTFYVRATDPVGNTDPSAASRTFTVRTAMIGLSDTTLVITAAPGASDNLRITLPDSEILRVTDVPSGVYTGSGVSTGEGCTRIGDYTAECSGEITDIRVTSADQADSVVNSSPVRSWLSGGPANDTLTGGSDADTLIGGPGADVLKGMNGSDLLSARDTTSDTTINCDGGIGTPGSADKAILDQLPKDPNSIVRGCETKARP